MHEPPPGREIVFQSHQRDACMESRLVLESVGISSHVTHQHGAWLLTVSIEDRDESAAELEAYRRDNSDVPTRDRTRVAVFGGAAVGVLIYAVIIITFGVLSWLHLYELAWLPIGRMRAGDVMAGEWWRTVTALTLHVDAVHLLSNLAFGCVFGFLAGRILGGGVAWLTIVVAGALGNFMNAIARDADHSSIGASTAVFAALGIMVAHALRPRSPVSQKLMKRWSPLIGGVLMLAFIGVGGERTDVLAHVTGFLAGLMIGWLGCRLPERWLASAKVQAWSGIATLATIAIAWIAAIVLAS